jgi:hypothetical protein
MRALSKKNWRVHITGFVTMLAAVFVLEACMPANYGNLRTNPDTTRLFKQGEILPDHTYYYYGWEGAPDAIVAIQNDYRLDSDLWTKFDPSAGKLEHLTSKMTVREMTRFNGAGLYDPAGNRMGVWWSDAPGATLKMAEEKVIAFIRPWPLPAPQDDGKDWPA